ncbi:uncharacterized protein [Apostichopus japonicus]
MDTLNLAKLFSLALLRAIGLITDAIQLGGSAVPMHILGSKLGIPDWIIDFRHEATHSVGTSSLRIAKKAVDFMIDLLRREYWDALDPQVTSPRMKEYVAESSDFRAGDDIASLLLDFQQEQFQALMSGKKTSQRRHEILHSLRERLFKTADARNTFCSTLVLDGYLIATDEQTESLNITEAVTEVDDRVELNKFLQLFWKPILEVVCQKKLLPILMLALVKRLSKTSQNTEDCTNNLTLGWINAICTAMPLVDGNSLLTNSVLSRTINVQVLDTSWHPVLIACVTEVNKYTKTALNTLLSTIGCNLPSLLKQKLLALMQVGFNSSLVDSQDEGSTEPTSDALEVTFAPEVVENMEMLEREDFAKLNSCCREAWSKASELVRWELYPLGKLPGQLDNPNLLNLLRKGSTSCATESTSDGGVFIGARSVPRENAQKLWDVQMLSTTQRTVGIQQVTTDNSFPEMVSRNIDENKVTIL